MTMPAAVTQIFVRKSLMKNGRFALIWPQHIALSVKSAATGHARVKVTVELVQPTGSRVQVAFPLGGKSVVAELESRDVSRPGEKISIDIDMTRTVVIDPQTEKVI